MSEWRGVPVAPAFRMGSPVGASLESMGAYSFLFPLLSPGPQSGVTWVMGTEGEVCQSYARLWMVLGLG